MTKPKKKHAETMKLLHIAMRRSGYLLPQTEDDVRATEHLFDGGVDLPDSLKDPEVVLHRERGRLDQ